MVSGLASTQVLTVPPLRDPRASPGCRSLLLLPSMGYLWDKQGPGDTLPSPMRPQQLQDSSGAPPGPCTSLCRDQQEGCRFKKGPQSLLDGREKYFLVLPPKPHSHSLGWCHFTTKIGVILPSCGSETLSAPSSLPTERERRVRKKNLPLKLRVYDCSHIQIFHHC